jgi:hypothetical protein
MSGDMLAEGFGLVGWLRHVQVLNMLMNGFRPLVSAEDVFLVAAISIVVPDDYVG